MQKKFLDTTVVVIFWEFLFDQIFLSPQVKQSRNISNKLKRAAWGVPEQLKTLGS